ncbi:MAG: hypothetical protein ACE5IW_06665, partial [bacterium]
TGTIDEKHQLILDKPIPLVGKSKVRIIILFPDESDIDERAWLRSVSANPVFDFLKEPEEDIYTHAHKTIKNSLN